LKILDGKFRPAASQASCVVIDPRKPNCGCGDQQFFPSAVQVGNTEIHMLVPLRNAERNALVELIFAKRLGAVYITPMSL
jgi:hypothetical protein